MRRTLLLSSAFCFGLLLLFGIFSIYNKVRVLRNDNFLMEFDRFVNFAKDPRYVFLGDSHPTFAIVLNSAHPEYSTFAYPSENWRDMRLRAELALAIKPSTKFFVVPIDDVSLTSFREHSNHIREMLNIASIQQIRQVYRPSSLQLGLEVGKHFFPLLDAQNRQILRKVLLSDIRSLFVGKSEKAIGIDSSGNLHYSNQRPWSSYSPEERAKRTKGDLEKQFTENLVDPALLPAVDDFFAFAESHHVQVIGVKYPVTLEYQQFVAPLHPQEVAKFYATKPFKFMIDEEHLFDRQQEQFLDSNHLTESGAQLFTPLLMREIEKRDTGFSGVR